MSLNNEIINRIFDNIGFLSYIKKPQIKDFIANEKISGTFDNGDHFEIPIYSAKFSLNNADINFVFSDLSLDNIKEFYCVLESGSNIYAISLYYDNVSEGHFKKWDSINHNWMNISNYWKAKILTGTELIVEYGLNWSVSNNIELTKKLINFCDIAFKL